MVLFRLYTNRAVTDVVCLAYTTRPFTYYSSWMQLMLSSGPVICTNLNPLRNSSRVVSQLV